MQIDIDFEVFKQLTARRTHESHTYNAVIRELLGLPQNVLDRIGDNFSPLRSLAGGGGKSFALRNGSLAEGTKLRATYKGTEHLAEIRNGRWVDENGEEHGSPSAAASAISGTNVNGLRFWFAKRPQDNAWQRLDILLAQQ